MGKLNMVPHCPVQLNHFCVKSPAEMLHLYFSKISTNTPTLKGGFPTKILYSLLDYLIKHVSSSLQYISQIYTNATRIRV